MRYLVFLFLFFFSFSAYGWKEVNNAICPKDGYVNTAGEKRCLFDRTKLIFSDDPRYDEIAKSFEVTLICELCGEKYIYRMSPSHASTISNDNEYRFMTNSSRVCSKCRFKYWNNADEERKEKEREMKRRLREKLQINEHTN